MARQLIDYLPYVIRDYDVFKGITAGQQPEFEAVWQSVYELLSNQFVSSSDDYGLSRWEKILDISPKGTDTPDDRRFRIIVRLNSELPYTMRQLEKLLANLCGEGNYSVELEDYTLRVKIALVAKSNYNDVVSLLERIAPQNLILEVSIKYNRYNRFEGYTHADLTAFTHNSLREEVMTDA